VRLLAPRTLAPRASSTRTRSPSRRQPDGRSALSALGKLAAQAGLAPYATYAGFDRTGRPPRHHYHLGEPSVAAAAAAGHGLPALLTALQLLGLSLSCDQTAQLARWHDKGRQLQLLTLAVLRTESRALMQQIHQTPSLRSLLASCSPRPTRQSPRRPPIGHCHTTVASWSGSA